MTPTSHQRPAYLIQSRLALSHPDCKICQWHDQWYETLLYKICYHTVYSALILNLLCSCVEVAEKLSLCGHLKCALNKKTDCTLLLSQCLEKYLAKNNHDGTNNIKIYTQNYFQQPFSLVKHLQVKRHLIFCFSMSVLMLRELDSYTRMLSNQYCLEGKPSDKQKQSCKWAWLKSHLSGSSVREDWRHDEKHNHVWGCHDWPLMQRQSANLERYEKMHILSQERTDEISMDVTFWVVKIWLCVQTNIFS